MFEFVEVSSDGDYGSENDVEEECVRRGSARANIPLSEFARLPSESHVPLNATFVAEHLLPLFEYAASVIPPEYHHVTPVKYQATAGMRLIEEDEQKAVYRALYDGLMESESFVFTGMQPEDISTLTGELEGFYGAVAANYLQGLVDSRMRMTKSSPGDFGVDEYPLNHSPGPIGALDMGGSSTQIVFLSGNQESNRAAPTCKQNNNSQNGETCHIASESEIPSRLNGDDFFSTSYLAYGVDRFRERVWDTLVSERINEDETSESCASHFVENPCSYKGYQQEWKGFVLFGTGDTDECIKQVRRHIPHPEEIHEDHSVLGTKVGGVEHPPIQGKFFAMSLYFFTLDSLRVLSQPHEEAHAALNLSWPTPSIEELHNALYGLCSRSWEGDLEEIQHDAHQFTRPAVLPHRCIESVYMVTLLRDGFGFHPSSRDITFTFLVDGSEVEWSLGMAIALNAQELEQRSASSTHRDINATHDDDDIGLAYHIFDHKSAIRSLSFTSFWTSAELSY